MIYERCSRRRIGDRANEAHGYRGKMIKSGEAPFKCRSGSRYLYVDEFGNVHWCAQTRRGFSKDLLAYTLRGPSRAVRHAENLQHAVYRRLRPHRLRDGRVALPAGLV